MLDNFLLSKNEQDTSHKKYMWHGVLAGNLNLVSIIVLCLVTFGALSSSMKLGAAANDPIKRNFLFTQTKAYSLKYPGKNVLSKNIEQDILSVFKKSLNYC